MKCKIVVMLLLSGLIFLLFNILWGNKWEKYYKNKIYQPPQELVQKAIHSFKNPGKAIDLGCGIGNDVAFLLKNGWQVWAIDNQPKAIEMLKARKDIDSFDRLVTVTAGFDDELKWSDLPSVDLLYACYALPFSQPEQFKHTWEHIKEKILPGGRFAGHFFGLNYQGFSENEKKEMTFLTKDEIYNLFEDFTIEYFQEHEEDGESGTGRAIHSHIFEIIAQKRNHLD